VGAAPTTTGRAGTARRPGSGKQDEKVYERNQRQSPVSLMPAPTWWIWAGMQRTPLERRRRLRSRLVRCRPGGHGEGLRRTRGEAAGAQLDTSLVDRLVVNAGTVATLPP
jgi:hypothetical protein